MATPTSYGISGYGGMILDRSRSTGYVPALRRAIRPGCTVLDLGAGTGFFALLACQFGAGRVYSVEPGDTIHLGRELAVANGCADRVVFIQDISTRVTLPEQVDIIISDLHGALPLFERHIPSIVDARQRFLAPGGVLIPQRETVWAALAAAPELYRKHYETPWAENGYSLQMSAVKRFATNALRGSRFNADQLIVDPQLWATLDYMSIEDPNVAGEVAWSIQQPGTAHGLAIWFDTAFADDIGFSNAPGQPDTIYGQMFLPWPDPVELAAGDAVTCLLKADLVGDDYTWTWRTRVCPKGNGAQVKADFRQSTFFGTPLSSASLRKREAGYRPSLGEAGQIERFMLSQMDGHATVDEIARRTLQQFPDAFADLKSAMTRAGELSQRFGR
jgi:protein arginine N-methyltransferase 1